MGGFTTDPLILDSGIIVNYNKCYFSIYFFYIKLYLILNYKMSKNTIRDFWSVTSPFSIWYKSNFVDINGNKFSSLGQYLMYKKAFLNKSFVTCNDIINSNNEVELKLLNSFMYFDKEQWEEQKNKITLQGNILKFTQNENIKQIILNTNENKLTHPFINADDRANLILTKNIINSFK